MTQLVAIAYVSTAYKLLEEAELEQLLLSAREHNKQVGITGVLLYHDGSFFQYFEGPEEEMAAIYTRIRRSRRHDGLIELLHRRVEARQFEHWDMGFAHSPSRFILKLAQASWLRCLAQQPGGEAAPDGLAILLQFWKNATHPF